MIDFGGVLAPDMTSVSLLYCIYVVYIENLQRNQIGIDFETKIGYISIIIPLVLCAIGPGCLCIRVFLFLPFPIIQTVK